MDAYGKNYKPSIENLEGDAELVTRELGRLMEAARDRLRRLQDVDAELGAADTGHGGLCLARGQELYELRVIGRKLMRAQAVLVDVKSDRFDAATVALGWLEEAEHEDRPWKAAA